jgi:hypothetical protein
MTKKEKFLELVLQLENIGDELNELLENDREENEEIDSAIMGLRISIDEVSEIGYQIED